jgi:non-canonical purine NTP pyrophosphatase (RdgB/HAM1 family)
LKSSFPFHFKARRAKGGCGGNSARRANRAQNQFGFFQTDTADREAQDMRIYIFTTNQQKLRTAQRVLGQYGVDLQILTLPYEAPEIQSFTVEEIACHSAKYLAEKEGLPVLVTDVGYFINALNGFPGPYIKQMNHYLTSEDVLALMKNKQDRTFVMKECLAFCQKGREPVAFTTISTGTIAHSAEGTGNALDTVIIREGQSKVQSLYTMDEMIEYFSSHLDHYAQFGQYYRKNITT